MTWIIFIANFWKKSLHFQLPMPQRFCTTGSATSYCFVIQTHRVTATSLKPCEFLFLLNFHFHVLVCISHPTFVTVLSLLFLSATSATVNKARPWHKLKDWWITIPATVQVQLTNFWVMPSSIDTMPVPSSGTDPNTKSGCDFPALGEMESLILSMIRRNLIRSWGS